MTGPGKADTAVGTVANKLADFLRGNERVAIRRNSLQASQQHAD